MPSSPGIFQLKISLLGISPMIWRRVLVSSSTALRELHGILQVVMEWDGIRLFQFDIRAVDYGPWELHAANPDIPLSDFGFRRNDRFSYIYDMGVIENMRSVLKPYLMLIPRNPIQFARVARVARARVRPKIAVDPKAIWRGGTRPMAMMPGRTWRLWRYLAKTCWTAMTRAARCRASPWTIWNTFWIE